MGANIYRMIRNASGLRKVEEEGWLSWHMCTLRGARSWFIEKLCCTHSEWFLTQCAKNWSSSLARHELTHIRRMVGWQGATREKWEAELAAVGICARHCEAMRQTRWRRGSRPTHSVPFYALLRTFLLIQHHASPHT